MSQMEMFADIAANANEIVAIRNAWSDWDKATNAEAKLERFVKSFTRKVKDTAHEALLTAWKAQMSRFTYA